MDERRPDTAGNDRVDHRRNCEHRADSMSNNTHRTIHFHTRHWKIGILLSLELVSLCLAEVPELIDDV